MRKTFSPATRPAFALLALLSLAPGCAQQARSDARASAGLDASRENSDRNILDRTVGNVRGGFSSLGDKVQDLVDKMSGNGPDKSAILMESGDPDARRAGINRLTEKDFARRPPYVTRYEQIARLDPDPLVRATAIRALNRSRDKAATPIFIKALGDPNDQIRLEACKALLRVPDPESIAPLLKIAGRTEENKDVRIAAADALRHYKKLEVARTLVSLLSDRDFGLAWQSRTSLRYLTGRDLKYDESAWLGYLSGPDKPLG